LVNKKKKSFNGSNDEKIKILLILKIWFKLVGLFKTVHLGIFTDGTGSNGCIEKCFENKVAEIFIYYAESIAKKTAFAFFG